MRPEGPVDLEAVNIIFINGFFDEGEPLCPYLGVSPVEGEFPRAFQAPFGVFVSEGPREHIIWFRWVGRM